MNNNSSGHSADVDLQLVVGGQAMELAQVSPTAFYLREAAASPPCAAELVVIIDGRERRQQVYLPHGISRNSREVKYSSHEPARTGS